MLHFGPGQHWGRDHITEREHGAEFGEKKTASELQIFPTVISALPASQGFLAYQGQKRTRFNSIIRVLIYHKDKNKRVCFSSRQERGCNMKLCKSVSAARVSAGLIDGV